MQLVSVVIPLYNTEQYIGKAIKSILAQTHDNLELLICVDGSTDNSLTIAKEFQISDNRIKVLENKTNKGHIYTYNRLFFAATGNFIMVQDSDDWSNKNRIANQVAAIIENNVDFCVCNSIFFSPTGKQNLQPKESSGVINIFTNEHWAPATILFRKEVLKKIPGFNFYFDRLTSMDRYFIMELLSEFKGYYLDEYLYYVQERSNSDHRSLDLKQPQAFKKIIIPDIYLELKKQRINTGTDWLKNKNFAALETYEQMLLNDNVFLAEKIRNLATNQVWYKNYKNAFELIKEAIKIAPFYPKNYRTLLLLLLCQFQLIQRK